MTGKDFYRIETEGELSDERLRSLVFFYEPLISDASKLYLQLFLRQNSLSFEKINDLLSFLNMPVSDLEKQVRILNEYGLVKTLRNDDRYIFVLQAPLTRKEFINDDLLVRHFIIKTSGSHYQQLLSQIELGYDHQGFADITARMDPQSFEAWDREDETYLKKKQAEKNSPTLFDIERFLKDISTNLLPMRLRSKQNMQAMARLADLYNISYDRMRTFLPNVADTEAGVFDLNKLRYLCMNAHPAYRKVEDDAYDVPCQLYLMSLQDGKELTDYDKKIIFNLAERYHLNVPVINVLLQHCLKNCDNRLIEKYIYAIASDLYRNDIADARSALKRLSGKEQKKAAADETVMPDYDPKNNIRLSDEELKDLLALRKDHE